MAKKQKTTEVSVPHGPFDDEVWSKAVRFGEQYKIVLEMTEKDKVLARCLEIPTAFAIASTPSAAVKKLREVVTVIVATMLEMGKRAPAPSAEGKREAQVNVRLSSEERLLLEEAARKQGFKGLSDYFRSAALRAAIE